MKSEKCLSTKAKESFSRKKSAIDWHKVCRVMLDRSLPTNPLTTQPDGLERAEEDNLNISLELVEQRQHHGSQILSDPEELSYPSQEEQIARTFPQEQFLTRILQQRKSPSQGCRIAIVGESGTGKTFFLQKIASWVLEKTEDVPIWITSSQLGTNLFDQYLRQKWLPQAANSPDLPPIEWQEAFEELLDSGRVWLLIDGVDERLLRLLTVAQQIRSWTDKVRIVLTCRTHIWEDNKNLLSAFDTYQTLELTYPEQVREFIVKWFNPDHLANDKKVQGEDLGEKLFQVLNRPEKVQIRQIIKNPLRLALLCRLWQRQPQDLPDTRSQLYQKLIPEFYQWKAEATPTNAAQQQELNAALGKLALLSMQQAKSFPYNISHRLVAETLGEDTPLLRLAIRLGWLQSVGVFTENPQEKYYAFFDPTFQEYFAARTIEDWHFFLKDKLEKENPLDSPHDGYRIFDPHWKPTILLWLGREDIAKQAKEDFIKALIEFDDGCGCENFYGKRAYFLATAGLSEFGKCSQADKIVAQLVEWGFAELDRQSRLPRALNHPFAAAARAALAATDPRKAIALLVKLIETTDNEQVQNLAFKSLEQIGKDNVEAIAALQQILDTTKLVFIRWQAAECLGKIEPGNQKAIATLAQLLDPNTPEEIQQIAFDRLEKIGAGNQKAIATLINLLRTATPSATQRRAFECLAIIGRGNQTAIATLVQLIRTNEDEGVRRQAAETLEKIDPGNPTAIAVLVQLLQSAQQREVRQQAVYSLGEIDPGNLEAIAALVQLLETSDDVYMRWLAVSSLGKIAIGNQEAIDALVKIIKSPQQGLLHKEAIDSLEKIHPNHPVAFAALVRLMQYADDESIRREAAESLGKIDPANAEAIAALQELLRTSYDEFTCRQAAYSLGKIDPGNLEATKALVKLIQLSRDKDVRSLAAESLGEIGSHNPAAIATLIRLIQSARDKDTLRQAAKSLAKVGAGNREAISVLLGLLQSSDDETIRAHIADSLIHLLQDRQMMLVVSTLRDGFLYKSATPDLPSYKVMWHCAQRLPYPEFHQAWYFRPLPVQPEIDEAPETLALDFAGEIASSDRMPQADSANAIDLFSRLQQAIADDTNLGKPIHLVGIDSSQFIDPDNPLVDIYDRMLAQNCPKFEYGVPDTMAKLRLYWNMLRRNYPDKTFVLVFDENRTESERQGFSPLFLEMLSKFEGSICVVTDQSVAKLQQFSPNDPQLVRAIADWIAAQSQDRCANEIS
ncbi:HEAT repeat domain-containing protein [Pleurocapsa sp. PCC 7327]|uniref:HEAT repeat domain-containing protein n=1 Tax=Pleurocapsa sp. PCC 7327 TaxID=118163 RepID=UPI00059BFBB6|nr:HEAT repeat domain-containing protein [Pleurocapsa sp. PCC 7327]